jgi:divalent metal cation (Fe/Co/Zn/Cd) transporter
MWYCVRIYDILSGYQRGEALMVYVAGIIGFIGGFVLALQILGRLLKDRPREDLLQDKSLRFTYGLLAWGVAGFSAFCAVTLYRFYFP